MIAICWWAAWWLGNVVSRAYGRELTEEDEAELCNDQAGYADGEYILGRRAYDTYAAQDDIDNVVPAWNTTGDLVIIKKDCPFKYEMRFGDTITLLFTRMEHYGTMGFDFTQKYQAGSTRLPGIRWFFAWEKYVDYYRSIYGEVGESCFDDTYFDYIPQASGSFSWMADTIVSDVTESRRDFYHQRNRTAGSIKHYHWRRRRSGRTFQTHEYGNEQHYGAQDGKLRVVLSATEVDQMTSKGQDTVFAGEMEFHEWGGTGDIKKEQYDALKQFYMGTCANRRNGTAWNEPWEEPFSGWVWRAQNDNNWDSVPFCTWMKDGWNASSWDENIGNQGGTCHMMEGIRCDSDGNVIYLGFAYDGLKGNIAEWGKLTGLESISCSYNQLTGTLPSFISSSKRIRSLRITHNFFEGTVPCLQGDGFSFVDISYNNFVGLLPSCFSQNPRWRMLSLEHCQISGSYPSSWGALKLLSTLDLKYNELSGTLPEAMCEQINLHDLNIEANRIGGGIPKKCLWTKVLGWNRVEGWKDIRRLTGAHNRLSGTVPRINGDGKTFMSLRYGTYDFDHNFFDGTITDQWDAILDASRSVTFLFRDNRLSGPLPPQIEGWSSNYLKRVRYDFADNYFHCEPDGRWPDWVQRSVDHSSSWWETTTSRSLGKCLPVAHPMSITPQSVTEGHASTLYVKGKDFVQRVFQTCRYTHQDTKVMTDAAAVRIEDTLIRCQVPATLPRGTYEVTVSNFGSDFADKSLLTALGDLPKFDVIPIEVVEGANAIEATIMLGGLSEADFAAKRAAFVHALAGHLGQEEYTVSILDGNAQISDAWRFQSGMAVSPRILVRVNATKGAEHVRGIMTKLKADNEVKEALLRENIPVTYLTVLQVGSMVVDDPPLVRGGSSDPDSAALIIWMIIASVSGLTACGLCGFIAFLYRMEKKGQAYFKEQLEDVPDPEAPAPSKSAAPPEKIGAGDEQEEGHDI